MGPGIRAKWPEDLGCMCETEPIQREGGAGVQGQLCNHGMVTAHRSADVRSGWRCIC